MGKEMGRDDHYNEENLEIDEASVLEHPKYEELQEKLVQAETKINEYWNEILRAKADVENMRKRFEKDLSHAHKYGLEKFVQNLLPVVDSIERGLDGLWLAFPVAYLLAFVITLWMYIRQLKHFANVQLG